MGSTQVFIVGRLLEKDAGVYGRIQQLKSTG
jgi:hypothetical protein